jgi:hypothetical protein
MKQKKEEKPKYDLEERLLEYAIRIIRLAESWLQETGEMFRIFVTSIRNSTANTADNYHKSPQ